MLLSNSQLERLRYVADPGADGVIAEIAQAGEVDLVNQVMRHLMAGDQSAIAGLPPRIRTWLEQTAHLPKWVQPERLARAQELFKVQGVPICSILGTASLVDCYACIKGVQVLNFTHRLDKDPYRRIGETLQYVLLVMAPGALQPEGRGMWAVQKIRLMHGAIRYLIRRSGRWNERALGLPICQEDLLGTLMTFSYTVMRNLRRVGLRVTAQEAEDYLYYWRAVGEMMGVRPELIPQNMRAARLLTRRIFRRHQGPSPDGVVMTQALLDLYAQLTPGQGFDGIPASITRHLVGRRVATWMQVPRSPWEPLVELSIPLAWVLDRVLRRSNSVRDLLGRFGLEMLQVQSIEMAGYRRAGFDIPPELRTAWGLGGAT